MRKIIWLFGENEGRTMNNNSFYFWDTICNIDDEIEKYFVVKWSLKNAKKVKSFDKNKRKRILWKNSLKHWKIFLKSNTHFVSLSYKDVTPSIFKKTMNLTKPIMYLQHGTLGIKKIGYQGDGYHNLFLRFFIYNEKMLTTFRDVNNFKPYQLYYSKYHPRYMELVRRNNLPKEERQFLYFLTWREYFGDNKETKKFIDTITKLVLNEKLVKYLKENNIKFKLCVHQFFDAKKLETIYEKFDKDVFDIVTPAKIDVMDELAKSELLITDFSSVGFDFTFLNKPVILFGPDFDEYSKERDFYCTKEELKDNMFLDIDKLVDKLVSGKYEINKFFRSRLPKEIDHDYVLKGKHIMDMYDYFRNMELNKIVFLGYRFSGRGGSVSATKALAEALLSKGYYVELASLKGSKIEGVFPFGLRNDKVTYRGRMIIFRIYERICRMLNFLHLDKGAFNYDLARKFLPFNIKRRFRKFLKQNTAHTLISTRESIHPYLNELNNDYVKNKVYFFHTEKKSFEKLFPGLGKELEKIDYDKMVFVSNHNYEKFNQDYNFKANTMKVIGNTLTSNQIVKESSIKACGKKKQYRGITLLRLAQDRKPDVDDIIRFGKYLKDKKCDRFVIDVYGIGPLDEYLEEEIKNNKLSRIIKYQGVTDDSFTETINHDFLIDFSHYQSFGMIYLEGILAGKKIYASSNDGSKEVLVDMKENIYKDFDDLYDKLNNIDKVTTEDLKNYYKIALKEFGPDRVANDFTNMLK